MARLPQEWVTILAKKLFLAKGISWRGLIVEPSHLASLLKLGGLSKGEHGQYGIASSVVYLSHSSESLSP
jgi:hypothetical protein